MGVNFYTKENDCRKCGRYDEIHLGKSSGGWQFSFNYNGGRFYKNVEEMKKWTAHRIINDESGHNVTYKDFWSMVKRKQTKDNYNHAEKYPSDTEHVIDGYSFSDCDFS